MKKIDSLLFRIRSAAPEIMRVVDRSGTRYLFGTEVCRDSFGQEFCVEVEGGQFRPPEATTSRFPEIWLDFDDRLLFPTSGGAVAESSPLGVVLHEVGHAYLWLTGERWHRMKTSSSTRRTKYENCERLVRELTNPIRVKLGLLPDMAHVFRSPSTTPGG